MKRVLAAVFALLLGAVSTAAFACQDKTDTTAQSPKKESKAKVAKKAPRAGKKAEKKT